MKSIGGILTLCLSLLLSCVGVRVLRGDITFISPPFSVACHSRRVRLVHVPKLPPRLIARRFRASPLFTLVLSAWEPIRNAVVTASSFFIGQTCGARAQLHKKRQNNGFVISLPQKWRESSSDMCLKLIITSYKGVFFVKLNDHISDNAVFTKVSMTKINNLKNLKIALNKTRFYL